MYTLLYTRYFDLKRKQKNRRELNLEPLRAFQKEIDYIEWYYNIFLKKVYTRFSSEKSGLNMMLRDKNIIVSLTSFPKRIDTVWLTIESLFRQSLKADMIILWLADTQFPNGLDDLPANLLRLQRRGLTIRFCDDLRSHKKYFYVMQEYPNDLIVLADDDAFYPKDMLKKLFQLHQKYPNDICCSTAQKISPDFTEMPSVWQNPKLSDNLEHRSDLQVFTGSGSLFPPNSLDKLAFDKDLMTELCPSADDLWLTFMAYKHSTKTTSIHPWRAFPVFVYGTSLNSLYNENVIEGNNDIQWKKLLNYFCEENSDR